MMRNPALPIVEMLSRFRTFASTRVAAAVMISPSSGWFQIGRSNCALPTRPALTPRVVALVARAYQGSAPDTDSAGVDAGRRTLRSSPQEPGYTRPMVDENGRDVGFEQANAVQRSVLLVAGAAPMAWLFARVLHHLDGPVLRRSGGRRSLTSALTGLPIVELRTVGARSGEPRTLPVIGVPDRDRLVLVASNYGQRHNPGWYYNLKATPRCSVVFRGRRYEMEAYESDGEERERLWELDVSVYPPRNQYARRAGSRRIPVMVLQPAPSTS